METEFDVVILGSGPAGLQAAVHSARAKAKTAVLGKVRSSALYRAHVENYCCLNDTLSGESILREGRHQAEKFGAVLIEEDVIGIERISDGRFAVKLESSDTLLVWSVIVAMGISRNHLNVAGEKELLGKGVSYCVDCDANFYRGRVVTLVGDGSAAVSGALKMLLVASQTHLVCASLDISEKLRYQLESSPVELHCGRKVSRILGDSEVQALLLDNGEKIETSGVFVELGAKGAIELVTGLGVALDSETMRFVAVTKKQETNVAGLYAAGDICGPPWQIAKAVGEGCVAGLEAASWAKKAAARVAQS